MTAMDKSAHEGLPKPPWLFQKIPGGVAGGPRDMPCAQCQSANRCSVGCSGRSIVHRDRLYRIVTHSMSQGMSEGSLPEAQMCSLAAKASEAMGLGDFKEAIELLRRLVKRDPLPRWRGMLADAYAGRARSLVAKGMFDEAETALNKTAAADGTVREPLLYVQCLAKRGQLGKAVQHAVKYIGTDKVPAASGARMAELTAALWLVAPVSVDAQSDPSSELGQWAQSAAAAQQSLAAWVEGKPAHATPWDRIVVQRNRVPMMRRSRKAGAMPSITTRRRHRQETSTTRSKAAASPNVLNGNSRCALLAFIGRAPYRSAARTPVPVASLTAAQAECASPILSRCSAGTVGGDATVGGALSVEACFPFDRLPSPRDPLNQ